jgi:chemotaxis protein MotA
MWRNRLYIAAGGILVALCAVLLGSGRGLTLVNLPGLVLVLGGTFVASVIGHSLPAVLALLRRVPRLLRETPQPGLADRDTLLLVAGLYRRGDVRGAERASQGLRDDFLLQGARLALDPYNGAELARVMQWRMRHRQEQDAAEVRILRTMAGFAPAFGMLGTVLGLVSVLGELGPGSVQHMGVAMGFGLLSTLYGLLAANLLLRPLALKLEDRSRRRLSQMGFLLEAVVMLYERQHPLLLGEYLDCGPAGPAAPAAAPALPSAGQGKVRRLAMGRA